MGKWWVTTRIYLKAPFEGRVVLRRSYGKYWKIYVVKGRQQTYICGAREEDNEAQIIFRLADKLGRIRYDFKKVNERLMPSVALSFRFGDHKGFLIFDNVNIEYKGSSFWGVSLWARWNKKRRGYQLCACEGYKVLWRLCYLRRMDALVMMRLLATRRLEDEFEVVKRLREKYGVYIGFGNAAPHKPSVEDHGWGEHALEAAEDGSLTEEIQSALEDGDYERARELAGEDEEYEDLLDEDEYYEEREDEEEREDYY